MGKRNEPAYSTKYTCKYCNKEFTSPVEECTQCGASEFVQVTYIVKEDEAPKNSILKTILKIIGAFILINMVGFIILIIIGAVISGNESSDYYSNYTELEYEYDESLLTDESKFIGKTFDSADNNYEQSFRITGKFDGICKVYQNIYSSQFQCMDFSLPCNVEIKDDSFSLNISELRFYYYSNYGEVQITEDISGEIDKDVSLYLVDSEGNKNRLAIEKYDREEYDSIAEYLNSDEYTKRFTIHFEIIPYEKILVVLDEDEYEFELNYSRASGSIEYYGLEPK